MAARIDWRGPQVGKQVRAGVKKAMRQAGTAVMRRAKSLCPVGTEEKFAGEGKPPWNSRVPGTLRNSIRYRLIKKGQGVQVLAGDRSSTHLTAFYARFQEFGPLTGKRYWKFKPFLYPALEGSKGDIRSAFEDKLPND